MIKKLIFCIIATLSTQVYAQLGGTSTYNFLDLTPSPHVAALGGEVNATPESDASLPFYNPGLLDSTMNNYLSLNYVNFFAGINFGYAAYARTFRDIGNFSTGIFYINYGTFTEADESGFITGSFRASEYAFNLSYSRYLPWLDSVFLVGVNVKPLLSVFERYTSFGLVTDLGITYRHPGRLLTAALVLRNMGGQLTPYSDGGREPVPFELQLGISQRLQYAPFRFSLVVQHLETPRLAYPDDESSDSGIGTFADELMRHLVFGVECFPFKVLVLRAGYNYNRRQDMKLSSRTGMVGFSWGLGVHISRFRIDYARSTWHLAGASNHFSINVDLGKKY